MESERKSGQSGCPRGGESSSNSGATQKKSLPKASKQSDGGKKNSKAKPKKKQAKNEPMETVDEPTSTPSKILKPRKSDNSTCVYDNNVWPQLSDAGNMRKSKYPVQRPKSNLETKQDYCNFRQNSLPEERRDSMHGTVDSRQSKTPDFLKEKHSHQYSKQPQKEKQVYQPYIPLFEVQQGLKRGEFIEGALRINPRNYEDAYINAPNGQTDIYIRGTKDRNRALNGDVVVVQLNAKHEWRVLCDAVKDYQDKHGQNVVETVYSPDPSPCKVHTPDRFSRLQSRASSSYNGSAIGQQIPECLDQLAEEVDKLSIQPKKNRSKCQRAKNKVKKPSEDFEKGSESSKDSASFSQGSSDGVLSKESLEKSHLEHKMLQKDCLEMEDELVKNDQSKIESLPVQSSLIQGSLDSNNSITDINVEGEKKDGTNVNSWQLELSLGISPEELLDLENGLPMEQFLNQNLEDFNDNLSSHSSKHSGIIVPPDELSGDEFTDSVSSTSSLTHDTDQTLENKEFLDSQQDAMNNNSSAYDNNLIINQSITMDQGYLSTAIHFIPSGKLMSKTPIEQSCKLEEKQLEIKSPTLGIVSDSVCVAEVLVENQNNNNLDFNEHFHSNSAVIEPFPISHEPQRIDTSKPKTLSRENKIRKRKPRKKKSFVKDSAEDSKHSNQIVGENQDDSPLLRDPESYSVFEIIAHHPQWERFVQKTGVVVYILERKHSGIAAGHIKPLKDGNRNLSLFSPKDNRFPRILLPMSDCPKGFCQRPNDFANYLFLAEIGEWKCDSKFATGRLIKTLGKAGDIEPETIGILSEHGIIFDEFPDQVLHCLPKAADEWTIPSEEYTIRKDLRKLCTFTIDPATARDMDDAVSIECLPNGNYFIGVHIADVSYFVKENTPLDECARNRATSVYLVQKVIPMLPRLLCDNLCSLTPGEDRLAFSVMWEMTPDAAVVNVYFQRSVIKSCIKMSYEHAQEMIDNPAKSWDPSEHPAIYGPFTIPDIATRVLLLHNLAVKMRHKRFSDGALALNQTKLEFSLDHESGMPSGISVYVQKDSNRLIEEFMLLANMTVAQKIYALFPEKAILRQHSPPQKKPMADVVNVCSHLGIHLDSSSSSTLQETLNRYGGEDEFSQARCLALTHLCSKPMTPATYFCSGQIQNESYFHHYALNVPLYTHFTSPIRRYPDILVHRLLSAALGYCPLLVAVPQALHAQACHCSDKKLNADRASDASNELFFASFVRICGPIEAKAIVVGIMDHSFDCLMYELGIVKRVYCDKLTLKNMSFSKQQGVHTLTLVWAKTGQKQTIMMFSLVDVIVTVTEFGSLHVVATLKMSSDK